VLRSLAEIDVDFSSEPLFIPLIRRLCEIAVCAII